MTDAPAGWKPDPTGRHDHRYFDGNRWTEHVSDAGVAATDPFDGPAGAPAGPAAPQTATAPDATTPGESSTASSASRPEPSADAGSPDVSPSPTTPDSGAAGSPVGTGSPTGGTATEPAGPSTPSSPEEPASTFRMTEAGTEGPDEGAPASPADPVETPTAAGGPVSSWTQPTVVNEPTPPITTPSADEPTSTFRMSEEGTDLGLEGSGLEGIATEAPSADDLTLADALAPSEETTVLPVSPPPPTFIPPDGRDDHGDRGSRRRLLIGAGVLAVVAVVAGILLLGGDDDSGGTLQERIATELREGGQSGLSDEEAECLAGALIDDIGAERLGAVDFSADQPPAEITDELNDAFVKAIPECEIELGGADGEDDGGDDGPLAGDGTDGGDGPTTDATLSGDQLAQFRTLLTEQYQSNLGLSEEKASCLANTMADAIEEGELDESQSFDAFFEYLDACGISVSELGGAAPTPPG